MTTETTKRHVRTGVWSTIAAVLVAMAAFAGSWQGFLKPAFVTAVAQEAADELDSKVAKAVEEKVRPLEQKVDAGNAGLKAVITSTINALERDIDRLKYIRDYPPNDDWTDDLRRQLFELEGRLRVQSSALNAIETAEK